jgi:hypothetical protein
MAGVFHPATSEVIELTGNGAEREQQRPRKVRLPGFVGDDEIGLGDVIKRATSTIGIRPCGGCQRRAEALNRRVVFTNRSR